MYSALITALTAINLQPYYIHVLQNPWLSIALLSYMDVEKSALHTDLTLDCHVFFISTTDM